MPVDRRHNGSSGSGGGGGSITQYFLCLMAVFGLMSLAMNLHIAREVGLTSITGVQDFLASNVGSALYSYKTSFQQNVAEFENGSPATNEENDRAENNRGGDNDDITWLG